MTVLMSISKVIHTKVFDEMGPNSEWLLKFRSFSRLDVNRFKIYPNNYLTTFIVLCNNIDVLDCVCTSILTKLLISIEL